jgi:hypothetical protein
MNYDRSAGGIGQARSRNDGACGYLGCVDELHPGFDSERCARAAPKAERRCVSKPGTDAGAAKPETGVACNSGRVWQPLAHLEYLHNGPCLTDVGCTYKKRECQKGPPKAPSLYRRHTAPSERGKDTFGGTQGRAPGCHRVPPKRECFQNRGGGDPRDRGLFLPGRSLELWLDLLRPVQGIEFLAAHAIGFACSGLAIPHRHSRVNQIHVGFDITALS